MVPQQQRRRRRRAIPRASERRLVVARGAGGFGFTIAGQRPCVVSAVAAGGPAERAGLRAGDALVAVDGASVARAPHAAVARLVAAAPGAIALSVSPRDSPPTDTEDTEPDERARTRRRHPPPRRRPHPLMHHPGCHAATSTVGVNEILQNLSRAHLGPNHGARLECRAVVCYLGTIDTPQAAPAPPAASVRNAVRKLRQERRSAAPVLLTVLPGSLILRRPAAPPLAHYHRDRILYAGCGSDADTRYFGLVTSAETAEAEDSHGCHVFAVDPRLADHETHVARAREFQIACTSDPVAERCLEFPPSAEYVVGVIRGMYSLPAEECASPDLQQISKLAVKGDSPALGNFARNNAAFRVPRDRRPARREEVGAEAPDFVANSPQPSNHSEITTTSSNSDSGIGFHNDGRNIADRILVVEFAGGQPPPNRYRGDTPRRPMGLVGCGSFDADGSFLSNTTPVVDGFGGQGRPLNLDDVIVNANDTQTVRHVGPRNEDDNYNYNNVYGNLPSGSRYRNPGVPYHRVHPESDQHYAFIPHQLHMDLQIDHVADTFNSVEIYEESRRRPANWQSNESIENGTVLSGGTSKASMDTVSVYSSRSHEEARPVLRRHMQASLDDMLVLGLREPAKENDDDNFVHPADIKCKVRKSLKPLNFLSKTKSILTGRERDKSKEERRRAISASAGDVCGGGGGARAGDGVPAAASEPDLRDTQSEQSSPFRRWTTGSGSGSSYRCHDHHNMYNKQMSEGSSPVSGGGGGSSNVARWSLGLEHLLADSAGAAAFAHFLDKEFAAENIRFWWSCEQYRNTTDPTVRRTLAGEIWQRHLAHNADEPVNVDAAAKRHATLLLCHHPPPADLFAQAQKQIFNVMKFDSYPRFLRSGTHAECARADLRGLPPPYAHAHDKPTGDDTAKPNNLKKSASNVSERRRSGGASLLPWRMRPASRERPPHHHQHPHTDVVKCSQTSVGQPLCRVMLPDGATSVVNVEGGVTVAHLVDRLLQRRNLTLNTYDVLLKDPNQGESPSVDLQSSSSVLSGREAIVERRAVVRLELVSGGGGAPRCVLVRCGGGRRLQHVLRRVGARYRLRAPAAARGPDPLHPDTLMQDLDGCRLQVHELGEGGDTRGSQCDRDRDRDRDRDSDADADSLSELALRLHDDRDVDAQSNSTSSSRSNSVHSHSHANGAQAQSRARVRAALRPGAALHHHPPDFLDNLRETQRQRVQKRTPPSSGGCGPPSRSPSPSPPPCAAAPAPPRTPPPLPPKPAARPAPAPAPALV